MRTGLTTCWRWGALWRSNCLLDGESKHVMFDKGMPKLFHTRKEAAAWIKETHGYIAKRQDLRREPHGWRMPIPVRVFIKMNPTSTTAAKT